MSIFRTATKQALREIIEEQGTVGRFGVVLAEDKLELTTDRIVDLFEMTLNLRSHAASTLSAGTSNKQTTEKTNYSPTAGFKLPRTRIALSEEERQKLTQS